MLACIRAAHAPFYQRKNNHNAVCQNKTRPKSIALPPVAFLTLAVYIERKDRTRMSGRTMLHNSTFGACAQICALLRLQTPGRLLPVHGAPIKCVEQLRPWRQSLACLGVCEPLP